MKFGTVMHVGPQRLHKVKFLIFDNLIWQTFENGKSA